ncbi:host attachment protein [Komagataeibacter swingsii]|uniref:Host attachment protein n=1 Tax=Komagataeibacter swingsii TaxID=215220 RepID=A0A850P6Y1_9PROT|nr:host attachment protein [Komagataeibacter swingsii]AHI26699.1 AtsE protein [Komagataeibacter xylinus E25]NVN37572.1 host attachment protein [Komagataeibacter swingsii]RFO99213.1 attachment protein [Komagataeibacter xylinus]RFO99418.1 attachment protein [Komagataeibacter xylinus]
MSYVDPAWYVVADNIHARILKHGDHGLATFEHLKSDDAKGMDAPRNGAYGKVIAEFLNTVVRQKKAPAIAIAAPGDVMHQIRTHLDVHTRALVVKELERDLTNTPDHDLAKHFDIPATGWPLPNAG